MTRRQWGKIMTEGAIIVKVIAIARIARWIEMIDRLYIMIAARSARIFPPKFVEHELLAYNKCATFVIDKIVKLDCNNFTRNIITLSSFKLSS